MDDPPPRKAFAITVSMTEAHFRAIAKIAFHYALKMFPDITGLEREFEPIKQHIWGSGANTFVRQCMDQFITNFWRDERPRFWMHFLDVERSYDRITAYAQFFAGPKSLPPPLRGSNWKKRLGAYCPLSDERTSS